MDSDDLYRALKVHVDSLHLNAHDLWDALDDRDELIRRLTKRIAMLEVTVEMNERWPRKLEG